MQVAQWHPTVAGKVLLRFQILDDGTVGWAEVTGELPDGVTSCVAELARSWTFPPANGNVLVNYPLEFRIGS
jgi:hypothetical protein